MTMIKAAAIQMDSQHDKAENLQVADSLIREAKNEGANLAVLPEYFNFIGEEEEEEANAENMQNGETVQFLSELAKELNIWLQGGSILEVTDEKGKYYNTTLMFNPKGEVVAKYRKIHLFDADMSNGPSFLESNTKKAGNEIVTVDGLNTKMGLSICFDLRFPELYRLQALRGAEVFLLSAEYTLHTGKDHWEMLLRARAIENQVYIVAAGQIGNKPGFQSYGKSMIVDPWGTILATSPDKVGLILATIDLAYLRQIRTELPSLRNRQPAAYNLT